MSVHTYRAGAAAVAVLSLLVGACTDEAAAPADRSGTVTVGAGETPRTTSATTPPPASTATTEAPPTTDADPRHPVTFQSDYRPPDGNIDDFFDAGTGQFDAHGLMTYTGDFEGSATYVLGLLPHPAGMATGVAGASIALFDGTVEPCGSGTAVIVTEINLISGANPPTRGVWRVLPGYGTGDLATLSGGGTGSGHDDLDSGEATLAGDVTCSGSWDGRLVPAAPEPGSRTVEMAWSYQSGDMITDPGGVDFQGMNTDPANGRLGLMHGHGPLQVGVAPWPSEDVEPTTTMPRVWLAVENPGGWMASGGTRIDIIRYSGPMPSCGDGTATGSLLLMGIAEFPAGSYPDGYDPMRPVEATYSWHVISGFGDGVLLGATGVGDGTATENAVEGTSESSGALVCS